MRIAKIDINDDAALESFGNCHWNIRLEKPFDSTINQFTNDNTGINATKILDGSKAVFWSYKKENSAEFDGRFFVKIYKDETFKQHIVNNNVTTSEYITKSSQKIYSFIKDKHSLCWNNPYAVGDVLNIANHNAVSVDAPDILDALGFSVNGIPEWEGYIEATDLVGFNDGKGLADLNDSWRSHCAFFRGINVHKANASNIGWDKHGIERRKSSGSMDLHGNSVNSWEFEDVWFIDSELSQGKFNGDWGATGPNNFPYMASGYNISGVDHTLEIGFGGVQPDVGGFLWNIEKDASTLDLDQEFYDLNKNTNYEEAGDISREFSGGTVFRWKDDPNQQTFIITNAETKNLLRHESMPNIREQARQAREGGTGPAENYTIIEDYSGDKVVYVTSTFFRPDNYSKNYKLTFVDNINSSDTPTWAPSGFGQPIASGIHMQLTLDGASSGSHNNILQVNSLIGSNQSGNTSLNNRSVEVGMVVEKIHTTNLDDNNYGLAVISEINGNTLKLKHYDPDRLQNAFPAGSNTQTIVVKQYTMNGLSRNSAKNINYFNNGKGFADTYPGVDAVGYELEIVEGYESESKFPRFPAIFETEPKESEDLDIYYEITDNIPTNLNSKTINSIIPINTYFDLHTVDSSFGKKGFLRNASYIYSHHPSGNKVITHADFSAFNITNGDRMVITKPSGDKISLEIANVTSTLESPLRSIFELKRNLTSQRLTSSWHNCYSFGNGVESNRIRDDYNQTYIRSGVKASSTLSEQYKEEHRKYGLIYSGLYNSTSGVNNLNQFVQAEKITKQINPTYGSIQKLHSRNADLIALCEDKVLKILANKDAVFNADGNTQLTATQNVLGQTIPFVGEYGISKNPESFASEAYRAYFTDKIRGRVIRLSKDGLTPISDHGMKNWFKDNLKLNNRLIGSYDDRKDEYNICLENTNDNDGMTSKSVTFKENVKGWVSFKSFITENGVSCANEYYTFKDGQLWRHHDKAALRNTFHNISSYSSFKVILNDAPNVVKHFHTLGYDGSQGQVDNLVSYNIPDPASWNGFAYTAFTDNISAGDQAVLSSKTGWYVNSIKTNKEQGSLNDFVEKEGKWFNYIKGKQW